MTKRTSLLLALIGILALVMPTAAQEIRTVSFMTTFGGSELDALRQCTNAFTASSGIEVIIESNRQLVPILRTRIAGGSPPDVALVPQPGTMAEFARGGALVPLVGADGADGLLSADTLSQNYNQGFIDLGMVDGQIYGFLAKANSKSTVWYKPALFEELGLQVPTTWDELLSVQQALKDAGYTPWSIGALDWWTLTDWFENIYVRTAGPENYMKLFVTREIPWTDQTVVDAMNHFRQIIDPADENLAGGVEGTLATDFITAANMVFRPDNPEASMYYEGGFMGGIISGNFPELAPVQDFNAFMFPVINPEYGTPVVGGGDLLVAFRDTPEVREFLNWMSGAECNTLWAQTGAVVSPNMNVALDVYSPLGAIDAEQVAGAASFVFDGSDLMPNAASTALGTALQGFLEDPDTLMDQLQLVEDAAATS